MSIKHVASPPCSLFAAAKPLRGPAARKSRWRVAEKLAQLPALEVELLLSTHLTVVVRARVQFVGAAGFQDLSLVIARQHCEGDRPSGTALLQAAWRCAARLSFGAHSRPQRIQRLQVRCRRGRWLTLIDGETAAASASSSVC